MIDIIIIILIINNNNNNNNNNIYLITICNTGNSFSPEINYFLLLLLRMRLSKAVSHHLFWLLFSFIKSVIQKIDLVFILARARGIDRNRKLMHPPPHRFFLDKKLTLS